ncbi:two-component system yycF/yycG regulatory protein [Planococcus antarcticus DSM 14505]|uniref:Transcriptional regulator n=1 Tax=Planococcus antarcticus DSM 14505 TaxID=1185653 RepID=A0A1C7DD93_9BACL|nr:transcriptional regulator [Planococcus antarcticus DSM 14505]EIM06038.1 two-component system yycF/yycG regulatory protein [Planococcus antarcticus DSM 14505]
MKYVEHIKSGALFLLILLSLALTFTIWTFTPSHETIEPSTTVDEPIADSKNTEEIVRPVKLLFHNEEEVTGTIDQSNVQLLLDAIQQWQIQDIRLIQEETTPDTMESYMHSSNRAVIYYPGLVPFPVFDTMTNIIDTTIPESSFDRIVVEWDAPANDQPALYFMNTVSGRIYKAAIPAENLKQFQTDILTEAAEYDSYITDETIGALPIYVQEGEVEKVSVNYILEETSTAKFAEALLDSPELTLSADLMTQEYTDDSGALMRENPSTVSISYVQPKAETSDPAIPSDLLFDSIGLINGHGGWTDNYLYAGMNSVSQHIKYQLYVGDLPVFSSTTAAALDLTWGTDAGEEQAYNYNRPIYQLDSEAESSVAVLASGEEVLKAIAQINNQDLSVVTDIKPAYKLTQSEERFFLIFEPAWYFEANGVWTELTSELTGGRELGLE